MAIFCDFLAYFGQNLVAMPTSLRPLQSEMSSLDCSTTTTPVISNRILVISRRNAFTCIYSNFCPKIGCHGNAPLSLVYESVTDEFPDGTNPISKPNSAWICCIQLKLWPFLWIFCLFWPKFGCNGNVHTSIHALVAKIWPDKVVRWCREGDFLRPVLAARRVQRISDVHSKFALRPHHVALVPL